MKPLTLTEIAELAAKPILPKYLCPVCHKQHPTSFGAAQCAASTEQPVAKAGDIVVINEGYTWRDGKDDWLYDEAGYEFHGKRTLRFWYVITAITQAQSRSGRCIPVEGDPDLHRLIYHVRTLGIFNGNQDGRAGWTRPRTHYGWINGDHPPPQSVIDAAAGFVGQTFDNLL